MGIFELIIFMTTIRKVFGKHHHHTHHQQFFRNIFLGMLFMDSFHHYYRQRATNHYCNGYDKQF